MICPFCGAPVNDAAMFCERCGRRLRSGLPDSPLSPSRIEPKCRWCGLPLSKGDPICRYCLRDNSEKEPGRRLGAVLMAGGIIVIITGLISLAATISLALAEDVSYVEDPTEYTAYIVLAMFAVLAIILGFLPLFRKNLRLSVAGGIFSLLGGAFFIGIFGLILIILGRKGFKD